MNRIKEWRKLEKLKHKLFLINEEQRIKIGSEEYKNANSKERAEIDFDMEFEWREVNDQIESIKTEQILRLADKFGVVVPNRWPEVSNPDWRRSVFGDWYLTLEGYNKVKKGIREEKKSRQEERLSWVPLVSTLGTVVAVIAAFYAISNYRLNENTTLAEIGINLDNTAKVGVIKNYGKLPSGQLYCLSAQIEFGEKPIELIRTKGGVDRVNSNEDIIFPLNIVLGNSDKHAQFIIFVWLYNNGRKTVIKNRVFVRTPSEPYWVPTISSMIDKNQWVFLMSRIIEMQRVISGQQK